MMKSITVEYLTLKKRVTYVVPSHIYTLLLYSIKYNPSNPEGVLKVFNEITKAQMTVTEEPIDPSEYKNLSTYERSKIKKKSKKK